VRAVPRLCGFYPGICLTTEEKAWKNLSQGGHSTYILNIKSMLGGYIECSETWNLHFLNQYFPLSTCVIGPTKTSVRM